MDLHRSRAAHKVAEWLKRSTCSPPRHHQRLPRHVPSVIERSDDDRVRPRVQRDRPGLPVHGPARHTRVARRSEPDYLLHSARVSRVTAHRDRAGRCGRSGRPRAANRQQREPSSRPPPAGLPVGTVGVDGLDGAVGAVGPAGAGGFEGVPPDGGGGVGVAGPGAGGEFGVPAGTAGTTPVCVESSVAA